MVLGRPPSGTGHSGLGEYFSKSGVEHVTLSGEDAEEYSLLEEVSL
jgi:hypothetical protein